MELHLIYILHPFENIYFQFGVYAYSAQFQQLRPTTVVPGGMKDSGAGRLLG
jgi:hypothetical protein